MGALGVVTGATAATSVRLLRAARRVRKAGPPTPQPDWLEDAIAVALLIADASGPLRGFGRRLVDSFEKAVVPRIRSHPASAALGLAVLLSLPFVVVKWRAEHYPPALLILSFLLPLEVIFAFIAVVGRLVGVTTSARTERSSWPTVLVGASVGGVTIFAFHDSLLKHAGPAEGLALLLGASLAAGLLTVAPLVWSRRCWTKRST